MQYNWPNSPKFHSAYLPGSKQMRFEQTPECQEKLLSVKMWIRTFTGCSEALVLFFQAARVSTGTSVQFQIESAPKPAPGVGLPPGE